MGAVMMLKRAGYAYGAHVALKAVDMKVHPAEFLGILGPNGSGKSTLLKLMDGLLVPVEGEVLLQGRPVARYSRAELARIVAMVAQETHFQFPFSVQEVVLMGRFPHLGRFAFEGMQDVRIAHEALASMQCLHLARRSIQELSGGEKQRVLIARALAQEPSVVLLDEPTSFLDLRYKREIFERLSQLTRRKGLSVVVVSHEIDLAAQYCDRLFLLKEGQLFASGTPEQVIGAANIEAVYGCPVLVDRNPATAKPRVSLV
jgi:iron complex transport system ATP-binding protein